MENDNTKKLKTKDFRLLDDTTGETLDGRVKLTFVEEKKSLYAGYFTSFHQDRHLAKALSDGAYKLNGFMRSYMTKGNWIKLTQGKMIKDLNSCQRSMTNWMGELKRLDVIRGDKGKYMYNPRIAINGGSKYLKEALHNYDKLLDRVVN
jgi:hypothetical protein